MNKLLSANLARLRRDKIFWVFFSGMVLFGVYSVCNALYSESRYGETQSIDSLFFRYCAVIGVVTVAFACLFLGTEHRDGGLRNKLIVGHTRGKIYLANWVTVVLAGILMILGYLLPVCLIGLPVFGVFQSPPLFVGMALVGSLLMTAAFCSLGVWLGMSLSSRALSAVIGIFGVIALLLFSTSVDARLSAPEFEHFYVIDSAGNPGSQLVENARYLKGTERAVYQFVHEFLPTGQAVQYTQLSCENVGRMQLYALLLSAGTAAAGLLLFRRKDLK